MCSVGFGEPQQASDSLKQRGLHVLENYTGLNDEQCFSLGFDIVSIALLKHRISTTLHLTIQGPVLLLKLLAAFGRWRKIVHLHSGILKPSYLNFWQPTVSPKPQTLNHKPLTWTVLRAAWGIEASDVEVRLPASQVRTLQPEAYTPTPLARNPEP